jgi:hypothetical protein
LEEAPLFLRAVVDGFRISTKFHRDAAIPSSRRRRLPNLDEILQRRRGSFRPPSTASESRRNFAETPRFVPAVVDGFGISTRFCRDPAVPPGRCRRLPNLDEISLENLAIPRSPRRGLEQPPRFLPAVADGSGPSTRS